MNIEDLQAEILKLKDIIIEKDDIITGLTSKNNEYHETIMSKDERISHLLDKNMDLYLRVGQTDKVEEVIEEPQEPVIPQEETITIDDLFI